MRVGKLLKTLRDSSTSSWQADRVISRHMASAPVVLTAEATAIIQKNQ